MDEPGYFGLTEEEAARQLAEEGYNQLPTSERRTLLGITWDIFRDPIFLILLACGSIYLLLGEPEEALILLCFVLFIVGIGLYQENRTERALEALQDLSSPRALVIRAGQSKRIAGREVVRGDIVLLREGDRIPADAVLLEVQLLYVDESLLTGEALPVRKIADPAATAIDRPGGDGLASVYSGTLVTQGRGIARVLATGSQTKMGLIGRALQRLPSEPTWLQQEMAGLVRRLAIIGISLCAIVVILYGLTRGDWLQGLLAGLTLAMAILPNEFPVVVTIFLALGAWRMARQRVLTRRVPALETLGSASVLCVDKTGTLTLNRMSVQQLVASGTSYDIPVHKNEALPEDFHALVEFSILASQRDPSDPIEQAFKGLGNQYLADTEHLHEDWVPVREYPLSPKLLAVSHVWRAPQGEDYVIAAKGAPEAIADLCHFTAGQTQRLAHDISHLADAGLRVLGVARSYFREPDLPDGQHDFDFEFLGLVGVADPIRPEVPQAIAECRSAGIRVVMITGDYPGTAAHIARQIGLASTTAVLTGPELRDMHEATLSERIKDVNVFARMVPEQKLQLVNALRGYGATVAMTGDGVNDAPALKAAHIGIAMGERGTDVARESAGLVLLDDDFSSIVRAIRFGRRIFDNLRKAFIYLIAIHIPIAGMSLLPVLFRWPLVLLPIHIAFLHLIIDPACSIVLEAEPEDTNVMRRPPREPRTPLFDRSAVLLSLLQGFGILLVLVAVFLIALYRGEGEYDARALTFTTLILANLGLIATSHLAARIQGTGVRVPNPTLRWVLGAALLFLVLVLYVPALRALFRFSTLHPVDVTLGLIAGCVASLWCTLLKVWLHPGELHSAPAIGRAWRAFGVFTAGLALVTFVAFQMLPAPIAVVVAPVVRGPLEVTLNVDGEIRIGHSTVVKASVGGRLHMKALQQGDRVEADQVLATIAPMPSAPGHTTWEKRVTAAKAYLRKAQDRRNRAKVKLEHARREREQVARRLRQAFKAADAAAKKAAACLQATLRRQDQEQLTMVHAPFGGRVLRVLEKSNQLITAGTPLFVVGDTSKWELIMNVSLDDAVLIRPGMPVLLQGGSGTSGFRARVRTVGSKGQEKPTGNVDKSGVQIAAELIDQFDPSEDGNSVHGSIVLWSSEDVLKLPGNAIVRDPHDRVVFVVKDNRAYRQRVILGRRNALDAEVIEGVHEGEQVIVDPPSELKDSGPIRLKERVVPP